VKEVVANLLESPTARESSVVGVIVPTLNAAEMWPEFRRSLMAQNVAPHQVLIVDSASTDNTVELACASGFGVVSIARSDFNHGGTRQRAIQFFPAAEILVYLTQDAILADSHAIEELVDAFRDGQIGAAFGRQLPRPNAGPIEAHSRIFNYPAQSDVRSFDCRERLGFKTIFVSNSFAAYRRSALESIGGFPVDVIFGEDTCAVARMLMNGWKVAYVAGARAYHSHEYSCGQEFKRYFDIGVLHSREPWLVREFGGTGGEGKRYVTSELRYLWPGHARLLPSAILRTAAKFAGYKLGLRESKLNNSLKRRLSMHHGFWQ
jgi:rhamnosyltransferase